MKKLYNILGIGCAGYRITKHFEQYPQYKTYKIDTESDRIDEEHREKGYYKLSKQKTIMDYEQNVPNLSNYFKGIKGNLLAIVGGSGNISGSILSILSQIKDKVKISILYVVPDISLLSKTKIKQHEVIYNVLQQYARSGVFEQMFIIDNDIMEINEAPFERKFDLINQRISYCYHMLNVFKNIESLENNFEDILAGTKLVSFGYQLFNEEVKDKLFFPLDNIDEKRYYFGISEKTLKEDANFYNKLYDIIRAEVKRDKDIKVSYGLYKIQGDNDLIFIEARSAEIQK